MRACTHGSGAHRRVSTTYWLGTALTHFSCAPDRIQNSGHETIESRGWYSTNCATTSPVIPRLYITIPRYITYINHLSDACACACLLIQPPPTNHSHMSAFSHPNSWLTVQTIILPNIHHMQKEWCSSHNPVTTAKGEYSFEHVSCNYYIIFIAHFHINADSVFNST